MAGQVVASERIYEIRYGGLQCLEALEEHVCFG